MMSDRAKQNKIDSMQAAIRVDAEVDVVACGDRGVLVACRDG